MPGKSLFYEKAAKYWANVPPTLEGVLGGIPEISGPDINDSRLFLHYIFEQNNAPGRQRALDCGAGIGRITRALLVNHFEKVDLVDQDAKFVNAARRYIGEDNTHLGTIHHSALQNFTPTETYDIIWCQWVVGHLKDFDLIDFLARCRSHLATNGIIVIKENIAGGNDIEYDEEDSSVARPYNLLKQIFAAAKYKVAHEAEQTQFPDDLYAVRMFALVPVEDAQLKIT